MKIKRNKPYLRVVCIALLLGMEINDTMFAQANGASGEVTETAVTEEMSAQELETQDIS